MQVRKYNANANGLLSSTIDHIHEPSDVSDVRRGRPPGVSLTNRDKLIKHRRKTCKCQPCKGSSRHPRLLKSCSWNNQSFMRQKIANLQWESEPWSSNYMPSALTIKLRVWNAGEHVSFEFPKINAAQQPYYTSWWCHRHHWQFLLYTWFHAVGHDQCLQQTPDSKIARATLSNGNWTPHINDVLIVEL